jgi:hypothetical protein
MITNEIIGEEFYLSPNSFDGYQATGYDATQLTQDEQQSLFTIKTNMSTPIQWAKHGHVILPSSLDLTSNNKASLHQTFWNSLIEFLHTDLGGNLSSTLNPLTASKLDHYLSRLLEGLSETGNKGKMFDRHLLNEKSKGHFIDEIVGTLHCLQHRFPYPYSQIYSTRSLRSIQCWNQCLKYYSSSIFKRRQNQMTFTFFLEIFPLTC